MEKFVNKYLDKAVEWLAKTFDKVWINLVVSVAGVVIIFLIALFLAKLFGDFNRCRRACKCITKGEIKKGMQNLKRQAPAFDKRIELAPSSDTFDFDRILGSTYSYSLVRRLPVVVLITTVFFITLSFALSVFTKTLALSAFDAYSALCLITISLTGFILYIISMIIAAHALKSATRRYFLMLDAIDGMKNNKTTMPTASGHAIIPQRPSPVPPVRPAPMPMQSRFDQNALKQGEAKMEEMELSPVAQEIIDKIKDIALTGGADLEAIKGLFRQLELERDNPLNQNPFAMSQINKAASVINRMLDTL